MEEHKATRKAGPLTSRGRAAWLAMIAGYLSVLTSLLVGENTPGWPRYQRLYGWGIVALGFAVFSVVIGYRDVKSRRRYHLTVLLLIFAIICATADGWVLVTAPVWAAVLMALKKRWFGPVAW